MTRTADEWVSLTDHAAHYVMAALRALGTDALAVCPPADAEEPEAVSVELFHLIFGNRTGQGDV